MSNRILLIEHPLGNATSIKTNKVSISQFVNESAIHLPEGVGDDSILIRGPVQRANVENKNRRIYPRAILNREMNKLQEVINTNGGFLGELDHPDIATVGLQKVPMCVRKLWWDDKNTNEMYCIAEILDPTINPSAGIAYSIIKSGIPLGISSRGLGSVQSKDGVSIVQEDFEMLTFDLVSDPSTHGALLRHFKANSIKESKEKALDINSDLKKEIKGWHLAKGEKQEIEKLLDSLTLKW